jgi:hypothetical protein
MKHYRTSFKQNYKTHNKIYGLPPAVQFQKRLNESDEKLVAGMVIEVTKDDTITASVI